MSKVKMICPCCGKEIILELDISKVISDNKINKKSKKLDIEFGEQRGGEKENE